MSPVFNTDEIFEIAEQIERNGAKFYRRAAKSVARTVKAPRLWERLKVDARWDSGPDIDVVVVSPRGRVGLRIRTGAVSQKDRGALSRKDPQRVGIQARVDKRFTHTFGRQG